MTTERVREVPGKCFGPQRSLSRFEDVTRKNGHSKEAGYQIWGAMSQPLQCDLQDADTGRFSGIYLFSRKGLLLPLVAGPQRAPCRGEGGASRAGSGLRLLISGFPPYLCLLSGQGS